MKARNLIFSGLATISVITGGIFSGVYSSGNAFDATAATSIHSTASSSGSSSSSSSTKTRNSGSSSSTDTSDASDSSDSSDSSTGSSSSGTSSSSGSTSDSSSGSSSASDGTFKGTAYSTRWGDVQVSVTIADGKITDVTTLAAPDNDGLSMMISQRSIPTLRSEVLSSQSTDVQSVSGATYTSAGYLSSLQSALDKANF